jgi:hypothetical protein
MMFPWHWTTIRWRRSNNRRDCEKGAESGKETVEEKQENLVVAFVGFLGSWARVEGDGKS